VPRQASARPQGRCRGVHLIDVRRAEKFAAILERLDTVASISGWKCGNGKSEPRITQITRMGSSEMRCSDYSIRDIRVIRGFFVVLDRQGNSLRRQAECKDQQAHDSQKRERGKPARPSRKVLRFPRTQKTATASGAASKRSSNRLNRPHEKWTYFSWSSCSCSMIRAMSATTSGCSEARFSRSEMSLEIS